MVAFNGTVQFLQVMPKPAAYLTSDTCNSGGSAVFHHNWFYSNWSIDYPDYLDAHINVKELLTVVLAAECWAHVWRDKQVVLYTENTFTVFMLNKGLAHNPQAMDLLRKFVWLSATLNFHVTARHIMGIHNTCIMSDFI